ncbi:hypothetical protein ACOSQ4_017952 [Xanthoceras sorbifolium]
MLKVKSLVWSYIFPITRHMKWAWELLFGKCFFYHRMDIDNVPELCQKLRIMGQQQYCCSSEAVECAVCLNTIEEGEEIRELRCAHLFHSECLDRWVRYKHVTCPLCRVPLASTRSAATMEFGTQVVVFLNFTSFTSTQRDTWWLRLNCCPLMVFWSSKLLQSNHIHTATT